MSISALDAVHEEETDLEAAHSEVVETMVAPTAEKSAVSTMDSEHVASVKSALQRAFSELYGRSFIPNAPNISKEEETKGLTTDRAIELLQSCGQNVMSLPRGNPTSIQEFVKLMFSGYVIRYLFLFFLSILAYGAFTSTNYRLAMAILFLLLTLAHLAYNWMSLRRHSANRAGVVDKKTLQTLQSFISQSATVVRDNKPIVVKAVDVVPGDLVKLESGSTVPADVRIVQSSEDAQIDSSIMSTTRSGVVPTVGEKLVCGTRVLSGTIQAVVIETGNQTSFARSVEHAYGAPSTRSSTIYDDFHRVSFIMGIISLGIMIFYLIYWAAYLDTEHEGFSDGGDALDVCVAILVSFTMVKWPFLYAVTKRLFRRRLAQRGVTASKGVSTVERLGEMNALVVDMTGFITQEKLHVVNTAVDDNWMDTRGAFEAYSSNQRGFQQFLAVASLCNGATFKPGTFYLPVTQRELEGNPTDAALLRFAEEFEPVEEVRKGAYKEIFPPTLSIRDKWMHGIFSATNPKASPFRYDATDQILAVKGSPDVLMERCSEIVSSEGEVRFMTAEDRQSLKDFWHSWSGEGQRVLMLCSRRILSAEVPKEGWAAVADWDAWMQKLCVVGLVGMTDPPRSEFKDVISTFNSSNVKAVMVTADVRDTSLAIGKQSGLFDTKVDGEVEFTKASKDPKKHSVLLPAAAIKAWSKEDWERFATYSRAGFFQVSPEMKNRIVEGLKSVGYVVGVTGCRSEDLEAFRRADIAISSDCTTCDDSLKKSAHFLVRGKNLGSLIGGVQEGGAMALNLRKAVCYTIPAGFWAQIIPVLTHFFLGVPLPLSGALMIAINLVTDLFPTLALLMEKPEMTDDEAMKKSEKVVDSRVFVHGGALIGSFQAFYAHCMYFLFMQWYGRIPAGTLLASFEQYNQGFGQRSPARMDDIKFNGQSVYFVTLVMMQIFGYLHTARNHRSSIFQRPFWKKDGRNWSILYSVIASLILAIIVLYLPFFQKAFNTRTVSIEFWFLGIVGGIIVIILDEGRKLAIRKGYGGSRFIC